MLYPIFALVVFTFVFLILQFFLRVRAVRKKQVRPGYFLLYKKRDNEETPEYLIAGQNHLANLFDTPVLFYVAGLFATVLQLHSSLMIGLAWSYVVLRLIHACIHCTYNHLLHRIIVFWASIIVLMMIWGMLMLQAGSL